MSKSRNITYVRKVFQISKLKFNNIVNKFVILFNIFYSLVRNVKLLQVYFCKIIGNTNLLQNWILDFINIFNNYYIPNKSIILM